MIACGFDKKQPFAIKGGEGVIAAGDDGEGARREKLPQSRCARQPPLGWGLWHNGTVSG